MLIKLCTALAGFLLVGQFVFAQEKASTITIGLLPGGKPEATQKQSFLFAEKLQAKIKIPIQIFISKDYKGLVDAVKTKKVDFALFSALTYVIAEKQTPVKVLLKKTWGGPFYYSALVVNANSKIKSVKDLKNKKMMFVDENSTSGFLYPKVYLRKNKISDGDFKSIEFSGNHAASVEALEQNKVDVIAVFSDAEKLKTGAWTQFSKDKTKKMKAIWVSEPIPNDPIVVRQEFYDQNPKLTHEIMFNMIDIQNESAEKLVLNDVLGHGDLMPATSKQYDPVREMYSIFEMNLKL